MKTCITCRHSSETAPERAFRAECRSPQNIAKTASVEVVTGEEMGPTYKNPKCGTQRFPIGCLAILSGMCGRAGRWWQPPTPKGTK